MQWIRTRQFPFTAVVLREYFSSLSQSNANQILCRLARDGEIHRVAYGVYRSRA